MNWWQPGKFFGKYTFGSRIDDFPKFHQTHYIKPDFEGLDSSEKSFLQPDKNTLIGVRDNKIVSATCFKKFIIKSNIIGKHLTDAILEIVSRFGVKDAHFKCDNQVEYDDGDVQMDVDFDTLGIFMTINLDGIILSVGITGDELR